MSLSEKINYSWSSSLSGVLNQRNLVGLCSILMNSINKARTQPCEVISCYARRIKGGTLNKFIVKIRSSFMFTKNILIEHMATVGFRCVGTGWNSFPR